MKLFVLLMAVLCSGISTASAKDGGLRIALVGDSTVSAQKKGSPIRGWGEYASLYLPPSAVVGNFAVNGASTRSFIDSKDWKRTLAFRPTHVLIQFGLNDTVGPDHPAPADAATAFPDFLRRFIREAREARVIPILITPVETRSYDGVGHIRRQHEPYAAAVKLVAQEQNVPVIDLHDASCRYYDELGIEKTKLLAPVPKDQVHFNATCAQAMAKIVMTDLLRQMPELKKPASKKKKER